MATIPLDDMPAPSASNRLSARTWDCWVCHKLDVDCECEADDYRDAAADARAERDSDGWRF